MRGPNKKSNSRGSGKLSQLKTAKRQTLSVQLRSKKKGKKSPGRQNEQSIKHHKKGNGANLSDEAKKKSIGKGNGANLSDEAKKKSIGKGNGANLSDEAKKKSIGKGNGVKLSDEAKKKSIGSKRLHEKLDKRSNMRKHPAVVVQREKSSCVWHEVKDVDGKVNLKKLRNRKRTTKRKLGKKDSVELDEASRMQRRVRYLLIKMKLEQNLIDAYSAEGWKGQSREKIRPEKELQRARKQIWKCKLGLRDAIRQLDSLSRVGSIENSVIAPDGSVYHEHIFCAKCKRNEAFPDNDIILCDGTCNCAFHQKCLDPPLDTEHIPPGDQGWFCKFCECKMEILEAINAHLGTQFSANSAWQDIFKEEAAYPDGSHALFNGEEEWPSDDSEDDDYNPDRREGSHGIGVEGSEDLRSDDESSSTSLWSSNDEYHSGTEDIAHQTVSIGRCVESGDSTDGEILNGRRQRRAVDYKKLHDEMFGKDVLGHEQISEDEDWGPKKRKRKDSDAASTLMTLSESKDKSPDVEMSDRKNKTSDMQIRRSFFRIPHDAVEKLKQVFQENQLPPRSVKESLSLELGLDSEKVSKWFKNARYLALKAEKKEEHSIHLNKFIPSSKCRDNELAHVKQNGPVTSKEITEKTRTLLRENKKVGRKRLKSGRSLLSRREQHRSSENVNQAGKDHSDDVSLKKLLKMKHREKRISSRVESRAAEIEFERLSEAKQKLQRLKQKLTAAARDSNTERSNDPLNHQHVIFVPVAVLKEKV